MADFATTPAKPAPLLVNEREAARALSLSVRTLYALRKGGHLPFVRVGERVLYRPRDLADFAERGAPGAGGVA